MQDVFKDVVEGLKKDDMEEISEYIIKYVFEVGFQKNLSQSSVNSSLNIFYSIRGSWLRSEVRKSKYPVLSIQS